MQRTNDRLRPRRLVATMIVLSTLAICGCTESNEPRAAAAAPAPAAAAAECDLQGTIARLRIAHDRKRDTAHRHPAHSGTGDRPALGEPDRDPMWQAMLDDVERLRMNAIPSWDPTAPRGRG